MQATVVEPSGAEGLGLALAEQLLADGAADLLARAAAV